MKPRCLSVALFLLLSIAIPALAQAGNVTITHTAGASTAIQNTLIPAYNGDHCTRFGLPTSCTTGQLTTAGCVVKTFVYKAQTITIDSCTIFTSDATGEQNYIQEVADQILVDKFIASKAQDAGLSCAAFKAASQANQDSACTAIGRPASCLMCP